MKGWFTADKAVCYRGGEGDFFCEDGNLDASPYLIGCVNLGGSRRVGLYFDVGRQLFIIRKLRQQSFGAY